MRHSLLLVTVAATALLGAPAAFAQDATPGVRPMPATPAEPAMPGQTPPPAATAPSPIAPPAMPMPMPMPMPTPQTMPAPAATPAPAAAPVQAAAATPAQPNNVIDVLQAQGNFTMLLAALDRAHLTDTLKTHAAVSIFAPTDAAFAAMSEADRTRLMDPANAAELRQLLLYHVVVADVEDAQIRGHAGPVETAAGARIQLNGTGAKLMADTATITGARLDASNGAVFAIDHVLTPAASQAAVGDTDEDAAPAPAATPAPAPAPAAVTPPADESAPTPPAATTMTTPPAPGQTAPNGQPAATNTTVAAPPVPNPTDGQVDGQPPRPTPPVETPDPADGAPNGTEPNPTTTPVPVPPTPQA